MSYPGPHSQEVTKVGFEARQIAFRAHTPNPAFSRIEGRRLNTAMRQVRVREHAFRGHISREAQEDFASQRAFLGQLSREV